MPDRVLLHTSESLNRTSRAKSTTATASMRSGPSASISDFRDLDREWILNAPLGANAATLAFTGVVLDATVARGGCRSRPW